MTERSINQLSNDLARVKGDDPTGDRLRKKIVSCKPDDEAKQTPPPPEEMKPIARYFTRVVKVEERFERKWKSGHATGTAEARDAEFENVSLGWFVTFEGSWESLYLGATKPDLQKGDSVEVSFRKKENK